MIVKVLLGTLVPFLMIVAFENNFLETRDFYYDLRTGESLKGVLGDSEREPNSVNRITFEGVPCRCMNSSCGCCAGINLTSINVSRRLCTIFTYRPAEGDIRMTVTMNEEEVYNTLMPARNPPVMCVPLPYLPMVNFCVRLYDVSIPDNHFHACLDLETRVTSSPILVLHFDCIKIGMDGLVWIKPDQSVVENKNEIFDHVAFEPESNSSSTSTSTPEQESHIGQLKI